MTSQGSKQNTTTNVARRLIVAEGATCVTTVGDGEHLSVAGGGLRVTGSREWELILREFNETQMLPDEPRWRGLVFRRPRHPQMLVMMHVESLGRLLAVTEQALVDAGRMGDL